MTRFVVMTRSAHMPNACWGVYRRVAVVETDLPEPLEPTMISARAKHVIRIVETWERLNVGKTERCAYRKALAEAEALAEKLNEAAMRWVVEFRYAGRPNFLTERAFSGELAAIGYAEACSLAHPTVDYRVRELGAGDRWNTVWQRAQTLTQESVNA
jgi:hypothetical protein